MAGKRTHSPVLAKRPFALLTAPSRSTLLPARLSPSGEDQAVAADEVRELLGGIDFGVTHPKILII